MRKTIEVSLATLILALCLTKAAGAPIEGTWEGKAAGRKAVVVKIAEMGGRLTGHAIFYVVDKTIDDPDAAIVGQDERELSDLRWDGKVLRFSVPGSDAAFEMTVTARGAATLKRENPEMSVEMTRR
jgi:hypothetical protein